MEEVEGKKLIVEDTNNEHDWLVYIHTNKHNNKCYIGITQKKPNRRWGKNGSNYLQKNKNGEYIQPAFARALNKYPDWDNDWDHMIFADNLTHAEAKHMEVLLIALYKTNCCKYQNPSFGYNLTDGGDGMAGYCYSEEVRRKIGEHTKEVFKDKERHPWYGKHLSDEHKAMVSENRKGKGMGEKNHFYGTGKATVQLSLNNEYIAEYISAHDAQKTLGIFAPSIRLCCKGKQHSAGGFRWMYKEDYEKQLKNLNEDNKEN